MSMDLALRAKPLIPTFDPDEEREKIMSQIDAAELDQVEVFGARLMVAKWIRTKAGSIHMAQQTQREDGFQGKVGLVLKVGPLAFQDDANHDWCGLTVKPGDWVVYGHCDGHDFDFSPKGTFDRIPCKILDEANIQMIVPRPDFAY